QFLGAVGPTIIFVMALVGAIMVGICLISYAGFCFLVIVDSTAAGMDEIRWPDEPFLDWLWKPPFLLGLAAIWMFIVHALLLLIVPIFGTGWRGVFVSLALATWLFFPISLYSSLSGHSVFYFLYVPLLRRVLRRIPVLLLVYALTAPGLLAGIG